MTRALPRPCTRPGCPNLQPCDEHPRDPRPPWHSTTASRHARGYDAAWVKVRNRYRRQHPTCEAPGCGRPMVDVDHVIPLAQGGARLDPANLQSLCADHHRAKTADEKRRPRRPSYDG